MSPADSAWTPPELTEIDHEDELRIASRRSDGSLRPEVIIWMVRAGDDLYVRAAYGPETGWNRRARAAGSGHVRVGSGLDRDVTFEPADPSSADAVTAAYEAKYAGRFPRDIVDPVVSAESVTTTLRIVPA